MSPAVIGSLPLPFVSFHVVEVTAECIEPGFPEAVVPLDPALQLQQRLGVEAVAATLGVGLDSHEARFPQHPQVARHGRTRHRELIGDLARRQIAPGEHFHDLDPGRVGQYLAHLHDKNVTC